ncbi:hypothetical protein I6M54_20265 [Shewanella algae]|uniref:Uncharacterized protein n=1 Tax=Shewanella algae TaxID=38313 RepID=A0AAD1KCU8_9GAMM|nr:hypothetical protein [Shewanella algae]MBO2597154.1 hypothetical protein [Shewanella algae]MBO2668506.1 hypothetical protein [Shewanella algae]BCV47016.1 hypothetical protein TUM17379_40340 [Shewanella algae]
MHRLKSRIIREWDFNHKGWLLEAARFLAPQLLALTLWDESERKPLLAIWPTEADSPSLLLDLTQFKGHPQVCLWHQQLTLVDETGLWIWDSLTEDKAQHYPFANPDVLSMTVEQQHFHFLPLQLCPLDDNQLLLRMSSPNTRKGRAISWLFIKDDQCHLVNRYKEPDEPELTALKPGSPHWLEEIQVCDRQIFCLCQGQSAADSQETILAEYRYGLPDSLFGKLSKMLGSGQEKDLLLQSSRLLAPGSARFSNCGPQLWLRTKGNNRFECRPLAEDQSAFELALTQVQSLGDIKPAKAQVSFMDNRLFVVHDKRRLNLCEVQAPK